MIGLLARVGFVAAVTLSLLAIWLWSERLGLTAAVVGISACVLALVEERR